MSEIKILGARAQWRHPSDRPASVRMYFHPVGENILENLHNRFHRPDAWYRRLVPEAFRRAQETSPEVIGPGRPLGRYRWSQKAGCSCGCSPGFILEGMYRFDIFVDVEMEFPKFRLPEPEFVAVGEGI